MSHAIRIVGAVVSAIVVCACTTNYSYVATVSSRRWANAAQVDYPNGDTLALHDVELLVRYDDRMQDDTLTLRIGFTAPDSTVFEELRTVLLRHERTAAARHNVDVVPYRTQTRFSHEGTYTISLTPTRAVRGIEAVGVNIKPMSAQ